MEFNYNKLRGRIKEVYGTQEAFAKSINMGYVSLSKRLNNQLEFSQREIAAACRALDIPLEDATDYFFAPNVQKHEQSR